MEMGATLGGWEVEVFFFLRFLTFHFLNKHEYIYIFFFYKTFLDLG